MIVIRQSVDVGLRIAEWERRQAEVGEGLRKQSGFIVRRVLMDMGHPTQYTTLDYWKDWEALRAYTLSALPGMVQRFPAIEGVTRLCATEAYDSIAGGDAYTGDDVGYIALVCDQIRFGSAAAFTQMMTETSTLVMQQPGIKVARLLRLRGTSGTFIRLVGATSREQFLAAVAKPEIQAKLNELPYSAYSDTMWTSMGCEPVRVAVPA